MSHIRVHCYFGAYHCPFRDHTIFLQRSQPRTTQQMITIALRDFQRGSALVFSDLTTSVVTSVFSSPRSSRSFPQLSRLNSSPFLGSD
ncbi:hypothetical protein Plhal304r1_c055g0140881 [Plasmopara halstedii]